MKFSAHAFYAAHQQLFDGAVIALPGIPLLLATAGIASSETMIIIAYGLVVFLLLDWRIGVRNERQFNRLKGLVDEHRVDSDTIYGSIKLVEGRVRAIELAREKEKPERDELDAKVTALDGRVRALESRLGHR